MSTSRAIAIRTPERTLKFGSGLPEERRAWLRGMLHLTLVRRERPERRFLAGDLGRA